MTCANKNIFFVKLCTSFKLIKKRYQKFFVDCIAEKVELASFYIKRNYKYYKKPSLSCNFVILTSFFSNSLYLIR